MRSYLPMLTNMKEGCKTAVVISSSWKRAGKAKTGLGLMHGKAFAARVQRNDGYMLYQRGLF